MSSISKKQLQREYRELETLAQAYHASQHELATYAAALEMLVDAATVAAVRSDVGLSISTAFCVEHVHGELSEAA